MRMMGAFSGIDMSMIEEMMQAERARGNRYTRQKETYQKEQNAWKDLNTRLDNFYSRLDKLSEPDTFQSKKVNTSSEDRFTVSAGSDAAVGNYRLEVKQLANQSRLSGDRIDVESIYDELETEGSFTLTSSKGSVTIDVGAEDSLRDIVDKVNNTSDKHGIRANIVDNRLVFTHTEYGEQEISVTAEEGSTLLTDLQLEEADFSQGQSAIFEIDGMEISRDSNVVDDVIEGLTFTLQNTHEPGQSDTIRITEDIDTAAEAIQSLVDQYNSVQGFITTQLDVGDPSAEDNETGALVGDSSLMRLQSQLRNIMTRPLATDAEEIRGLGDLGVEIDGNGRATFNREEFEEQMDENPEDVQRFFHNTTRTSQEYVNSEGETATRAVDVHSGFAKEMRDLVNQYNSSSNGLIRTRTDTYDRMIRDVDRRIETFNERMDRRQDRMIRQFAALDTAMMQAEAQMDQMMSQLAGLM